MHAFVVLGLVFFMPSQEIGLGKHLQNDIFCVEWELKPQLINQVQLMKLNNKWGSKCWFI